MPLFLWWTALADLNEARTCFDYCFRATNEHEDERRSMLRGQAFAGAREQARSRDSAKPDEVSKALDLDDYQRDGYHVAVCPVVGDPQKSNGALDPRVERAVDWLAQKIDDKAGALEARRTRETAATDAWDQLQKEKKEQRVFRKVLRKAHPQEGSRRSACPKLRV